MEVGVQMMGAEEGVFRNEPTAGMVLPAVWPDDLADQIGRWHLGVPVEKYHADRRAVSRSGLFHILKNPREFHHHWTSQPAPDYEKSAALRIGDVTHMAICEPLRYAKNVVAVPDFGDGRTKAAKEAKAVFMVEHAGKVCITEKEKEQVEAMAMEVLSHPVARKMFEGCMTEVSGYWVDKETGILCRCRPDKLRPDNICLDLKTTMDASEFAFAHSIVKYGYHFQAAFYAEGVAAITGCEFSDVRFAFIALEKDAPYGMQIFVIEKEDMLRAQKMVREALRQLRLCIDTQEWPSYPTRVVRAKLPDYAYYVKMEF